jgi:hypothetical protein
LKANIDLANAPKKYLPKTSLNKNLLRQIINKTSQSRINKTLKKN